MSFKLKPLNKGKTHGENTPGLLWIQIISFFEALKKLGEVVTQWLLIPVAHLVFCNVTHILFKEECFKIAQLTPLSGK